MDRKITQTFQSLLPVVFTLIFSYMKHLHYAALQKKPETIPLASRWRMVVVSKWSKLYIIYNTMHINWLLCYHMVKNVSYGNSRHPKLLVLSGPAWKNLNYLLSRLHMICTNPTWRKRRVGSKIWFFYQIFNFKTIHIKK